MIKQLEIVNNDNGTFVVDIRDLIGNYIAANGVWEIHIQDFYSRFIKSDDIIVDAGANLGYLTVQFAKLCKKVFAFEPQSYVFNQLCANVLFNNLSEKVSTYRLALGDEESMGQLWSIDKEDFGDGNNFQVWNWGGRGLEWEDSYHKSTGEVREEDKVSIVTLDSLKLKKCDIIKLDVQGYEWQLIKGGKKTIQNNLPLILLESNPERSKYDKKVLDFLKDLGYSNYRYLINTNEDCILINRNSDRYTQAIDIIEQMDEEYNLTKEF